LGKAGKPPEKQKNMKKIDSSLFNWNFWDFWRGFAYFSIVLECLITVAKSGIEHPKPEKSSKKTNN